MKLRRLTGLALGAVITLTRVAAADVPDFFPGCVEERGHCTECVTYEFAQDQSAYQRCSDAARAAGLVETCRYNRGGGSRASVFFCTEVFKAQREREAARGCGGYVAGAGLAPDGLVVAALALLTLALRRRRARG